jgi:NAD(P)-dependent dehydrogenase (short-subunit alcohol dehydrogenase family)
MTKEQQVHQSNRLLGKTVIVTGAGQGIGAAISRAIAGAGGTVIVTDIDADAADSVAQELQENGLSARPARLDVQDPAAFAALAAQVSEQHDRIDGLVNNAGINVKYPPLEMPAAEWDRCMNINLRGQWHGCQAVLPTMIARGAGSIVNIASVHGHQIIPGSFPYGISKSAILGLSRALGVEYAPQGVRVNSISPGYVETRLIDEWLSSVPDPATTRAEAEALVPARRFAKADEVAMTALFLLSDEAPYITATDIAIDGGRMALYHA